MRRIAHDTGKKKRPAPCCMAGVKEIFQVFASCLRQGEPDARRNAPEEAFKSRGNSVPAGKYGRRHVPTETFRMEKKPTKKVTTGEREPPIGACTRPSLCSKSLRPGLRPHDRKPTPPRPEHQQKHSGRAQVHGEQIPPFPTEKHVPPGSECCACALLPRENAFSDSPQGRLRHFLPA